MRPWVLLAIAGAIGAGACGRPDPLASCARAEDARAPDALARCLLESRSASVAALASLAKFAHTQGALGAVVAAAERVPVELAPGDRTAAARLLRIGGEAAVQIRQEARAWPLFERAFALGPYAKPAGHAQVAQRLARHALDTGDLDRVAILLRAADEAAVASGDAGARLDARLDLARAFLRLGDVGAADAMLASAAPAAEADPWYAPSYFYAAGDAAALRGHVQTAAALYQRCADAADAAGDDTDADAGMWCHQRLGELALRAPAELPRADRELHAARAFAAQAARGWAADPDREAAVGNLAALLARARGDDAGAIAIWAALWASPIGAGPRARIGRDYADALVARGDAAGAEAVLRDAFAAVIALRDRHQVPEARRGLPESLRGTAEALVPLVLARGDRAGALAIVEQAQRRDFADHLLAGLTDAPAIADAAPRDLAALLATVIRTEHARDRVATGAEAAGPGPHPPAAIGFWSDAHTLWRITIGPGGAPGFEAIADRAWLDPRVDAARSAPDGAEAAALGARLLPLAALPPAGAPLVIIPDPAIAGLALAALPVAGAPLVERHPIAIAPSFGLAWAWAARPDRPADRSPAIVLGDPRGDLPGAAGEATAVAATLGVTAHLGPQASRAALTAAADARVLHVAAHAGTDGAETVLHLADGDVTIAELVGLGLRPRVAVVASCASAAQRPDAMWSSAAAALAIAGAGAVVGALRSLDDASTAAIVADFYAAGGASDAITGLAAAQRRARSRGVPTAAWAFLVVYGAPASPTRE